MEIKFYKVTTKCGHVGRNNLIYIDFAIKAENGKEAAYVARWLPRAKHHDKYCIFACVEISKEEYEELLTKNNEDSYLKCKNIQEQNLINGIEDRIIFSKRDKERKHDLGRIDFKKRKYSEYVKSFNLAGAQ